jgi:hypothetical protein
VLAPPIPRESPSSTPIINPHFGGWQLLFSGKCLEGR